MIPEYETFNLYYRRPRAVSLGNDWVYHLNENRSDLVIIPTFFLASFFSAR